MLVGQIVILAYSVFHILSPVSLQVIPAYSAMENRPNQQLKPKCQGPNEQVLAHLCCGSDGAIVGPGTEADGCLYESEAIQSAHRWKNGLLPMLVSKAGNISTNGTQEFIFRVPCMITFPTSTSLPASSSATQNLVVCPRLLLPYPLCSNELRSWNHHVYYRGYNMYQ